MSLFSFKLPDLGEGTVSSEIVAWRVAVGQVVSEDDPLVEMSTDKAVVDVPSPVGGRVVSLAGSPGDVVSVGSELVVIETAGETAHATIARADETAGRVTTPQETGSADGSHARVRASPSIRRLASTAGIELKTVQGTGPKGRILRLDVEKLLHARPNSSDEKSSPVAAPAVDAKEPSPTSSMPASIPAADSHSDSEILEEVAIVGVRRVIAQRMAEAKRSIPHFSYIEEVDMTELESLREHLNTKRSNGSPALTYLPFIALAIVGAVAECPQVNARFDAARNTVVRYKAVHLGVATQTRDGLKVPVVRGAEARSLSELAGEIARVADLARANRARPADLSGSTMTITSLGKLGGIATTPVINSPEVAIVGVNKVVERPAVRGGQVVVRRLMNVSCSFDHRFVDGYDAAMFVQALKVRLEHPALLFASLAV